MPAIMAAICMGKAPSEWDGSRFPGGLIEPGL